MQVRETTVIIRVRSNSSYRKCCVIVRNSSKMVPKIGKRCAAVGQIEITLWVNLDSGRVVGYGEIDFALLMIGNPAIVDCR